jgi:DNA-binding transcriptional MerR regulator
VKPRVAPSLTIGDVAAFAGVTVRAVRHYHQRGLLTEPQRDASGYRRYDAHAVVDLIRIKALSKAGVPRGFVSSSLPAPRSSRARSGRSTAHCATR